MSFATDCPSVWVLYHETKAILLWNSYCERENLFQLEHILEICLCIELMFSRLSLNHEASNFVFLLLQILILLSKYVIPEKIPNIVKFKITVLELGPMFIFLKYTKFTAGMTTHHP